MNKNHGKDGKFISGGGGSKSSLGSIPGTFAVNPAKMMANRLPKDIKKAGIDSPKYKEWVYNNWR